MRNNIEEDLLDNRKFMVQKVFYPINLSFGFLDNNQIIDNNQRLIKPGHLFESIFGIKFNYPEDNLKTYRYPKILCFLLLVSSLVLGGVQTFYFFKFSFESKDILDRLLMIFWILVFMSTPFIYQLGVSLRSNLHQRRGGIHINVFNLTHSDKMMILYESLLVFCYLHLLGFLMKKFEYTFICFTHLLALLLRFCFKLGRNITLNNNILQNFGLYFVGLILLFFITPIESDVSSVTSVLLSIFVGVISGVYWLLNKEHNNNLNLYYKFSIIIALNALMNLLIYLCIDFNFGYLFQYLFANFFQISFFVILSLLAFYIKNHVYKFYEDIIPNIVFMLEPLVAYFMYQMYLVKNKNQSSDFFWLTVGIMLRLVLIALFLILPQILIMIDIKRNEMTLDGGNLGIKADQRDQMKVDHMNLLMKYQVDN